MGSSDSLLLPSEPPDITNWFSSYVYESPELNISENLEVCGSWRGNENKKEGYDVEDSNKEKEENFAEFRRLGKRDELLVDEKVASKVFVGCKNSFGNNSNRSQVLDSSDSLSLSSEPPDIKNWFSSYVYESPALDTSDYFRFSDYTERKVDRGGCNAGKSSKGKENYLKDCKSSGKKDNLDGDVLEEKASNEFAKCNRSVKYNKHENQYAFKGNQGVDENKNSSILNDLPSKRITNENLDGKTAQNHDHGSTKYFEKSSLNDEFSTGMLEKKVPQEVSHVSLGNSKSSGNCGGKSPSNLINRRDSTEKSSMAKSQTEDNDVVSPGKKTTGNDKENVGNDFAANGFVLARKSRSRRVNDENYLKMPLGVQSKCFLRNGATVASDGDKDAIIQRKVLSETTKFQPSDVVEITGKWRCPQKSKPNLGPPLKQLRLERWVRRL